MANGFFITFEGIDGCGKSTQLEMLADALGKRGLPVVTTRQPGGTGIGQQIRELMIKEHHRLAALAELLLLMADRAQHVAEFIKPHLERGHIVLSDRYTDSSVAFQGYGRGVEIATVDELNRLATAALEPDLTLLFDLDLQVARLRLDKRDASQAQEAMKGFDDEEEDFHRRVREGYLEIAKAHTSRFRIIEAGGGVQETHDQVLAIVLPLLQP
ncbi:MAG: dTMP kinase [Acidobacteriota bacterium]